MNVIKRTFRSSFARNVSVLAGGTAVGQAISILAIPILARLYSPESFGVLGVFSSVVFILSVVVSLRYPLAIPLPEDENDAVHLVAGTSIVTLIMCGLVALVAATAGRSIVSLAGVPEIRSFLGLLPIGIAGASFYQIANYWAIRDRKFRDISYTKVTQATGLSGSQAALGIISSQSWGLVVGDVVGRWIGVVYLLRSLISKHVVRLKTLSARRLTAQLVRYRRFPIFSSWAALLNSSALYLPTLFIAAIYGPQVAGWFVVGQKVVSAPMSLLGRSVSHVYFSEAADRFKTDGTAGLRQLLTKTVTKLASIGGIPLLVLAVTAPWLFTVLLGDEWRTGGEYVRILAPAYWLHFTIVPISQTLNVIERQDLQLGWDAARAIAILAVFMVASSTHLLPIPALIVYSGVISISYISLLIINVYAVKTR